MKILAEQTSPSPTSLAGTNKVPAKRIEQPIKKKYLNRALIVRLITQIDNLCNQVLNNIIHHPDFQKIEASWRSLNMLTLHSRIGKNIKIRMLDISWSEVKRDINKAPEATQSELFNKIYNQEFGMPGGEPFSVLIGYYEIDITNPSDISALGNIAQIAAAAFSPFISAVNPTSLGLNGFEDLDRVQNINNIFKSTDYALWQNLRKMEDARFIGLTLPKIIMRKNYTIQNYTKMNFPFSEDFYKREYYLWGNAGYAFVYVLLKSFAESNWFVNLKSTSKEHNGGLVDYLPVLRFGTDASDIDLKYNTEVFITDSQEKALGDLGFLPICQIHGEPHAIFYDNRSIQEAKEYNEQAATMNSRISATLQYMFCASRFAHYIKIIGRDKIGSFMSHLECEHYLNQWLIQFIAGNDDLTSDQKLNYPLRDARVQVKPNPGKPGHYVCIMHLQPRMQLEQIRANVMLVTELSPISQ